MVNPVWIGTHNFYPQNGVQKKWITLHWMVGNLLGTDRAFNGTRKASSTYGIEGKVVHQYVHEKDYPFSDGNTYSNQHTISIEHAGGWLLPDGSRAKPSPQTHETSAQLCADIARRHKLGKLVVGVNIFPHKHWVATACPGSLDIQWIANRANEINGNPTRAVGSTATAGTTVAPKSDATILKIQKALKAQGYNPGALDGIMGAHTRAAVVAFQKRVGGLVVDGVPGPKTQAKLFAVHAAPAPAPVAKGTLHRGSTGSAVVALQRKLKSHYPAYAGRLAADGIFGAATEAAVREFQRRAGIKVDGVVGPITKNRLGL